MKRVKDIDDPRRCRGTASDGGQCLNVAAEGYDYCLAHGGRKRQDIPMNDYLLEQFENRIKRDGIEIDEVKLLRENLLTLNMILAAHTARVKDEASMLANSGAITDLLMKAEKVTVSLNRLAISSGLLLAKPAVIAFAQQIVQAVSDMVEEKYDGWQEDLLDLSDIVAGIVVQAKNLEEKK